MKFYKLFVRLSHFCFTFLKKLTSFLDAFHSGFWLGALGKKGIAYSDELHYRKNTIYVKDEYNEKGLYDWEQYIVENHFADVKTIMLIAAGGGREVIGLSRMGFRVDAFECNPALVEYGNKLLKNNKIESSINHLPRTRFLHKQRLTMPSLLAGGLIRILRGGRQELNSLRICKPLCIREAGL